MAVGFIPFGIIFADAAFPEEEQHVAGFKGKIRKITKNSWVKHASFYYNERYNFLIRITWSGFQLLSTIALSIALMKGMLVTLLIHTDYKSVNLQYNTLGCLDDGTNELSTKYLIFFFS